VLVATAAGRPVYERHRFEILTHDHVLVSSEPRAGRHRPALGSPYRAFSPARDLDAVAALDGRATGEERRHILATCDGWVVEVARDVTAFALRAPFGGVATVARDASAALRLFNLHREEAGPADRIYAGLLDDNVAGLRAAPGRGLDGSVERPAHGPR